MICPNCHQSGLEDSDVFCSSCGADVHAYLTVQNYTTKKIALVSQLQDSSNTSFALSSDTIKDFQTLSQEVHDLEGVPDKLEINRQLVQSMHTKMTQDSRLLSDLKTRADKDKHSIEQLQKLSVSSLIAKIKGDKDQVLQKEEAESLSLVNRIEGLEKQTADEQLEIDQLLQHISDLKGLTYRLKDDKEALTKLINETTKGSSDPVKDQLEEKLQSLLQQLSPLQTKLNFKQRILFLLTSAQSDLNLALDQLQKASNIHDLLALALGGDGSYAKLIKETKMHTARDEVVSARHNIDLVRDLEKNLPEMDSFVKVFDDFFDRIFTNLFSTIAHATFITDSIQSVQTLLPMLNGIIENFKSAMRPLENDCSSLNKQIDNVRSDLLQERTRMIEDTIQRQHQ